MKFTIALVAAAAAGVSAGSYHVNSTSSVPTEYETETIPCEAPTTLTYGTSTYTVTEPTTLTLTYPVHTTSSVECHDCGYPTETPEYPTEYPTETPEYPTEEPTHYPNTTTSVYPTGTMPPPSDIPTAAANKLALGGAGLAGVLGLAALL